MLDGLGWVMNEWVKIVEPMIAQGNDQPISRIKVFRNRTWIGLQTNYDSRYISRKDKNEFPELGWDNAILAHHIPSGKLIATTSIEFADHLFAVNNKLSQDPVFQKTMKDLPMTGTAMSYVSPIFMNELRDFIHKAIDLENPVEKDYKTDDRFAAYSMLDLFLPEGAQGEGMVTTTTKAGLLTVSNSMYSHKSKILLGAAAPLMIGVSTFTVVQSVNRMKPAVESSRTKSTEDTIQEAEETINRLEGNLKEE